MSVFFSRQNILDAVKLMKQINGYLQNLQKGTISP